MSRPSPLIDREFLKRVARGTIYAAPAVRALVRPDRLVAQPPPSQKMGGGGRGMDMTITMGMPMTILGFDPPWG